MNCNNTLSTEQKHSIIEMYFDMIYRLAYSQTKNREHTDDVVQEVFLRFLKYNKPFESDEHIKAWLIRVTLNCSKNIFLSSWHRKTVPLSERMDEPTFDNTEMSDVYHAVKNLPAKYRAVIHLFYYEDMSVGDISRSLKINASTVKSQLSRGRKLLKNQLKGEYDFV